MKRNKSVIASVGPSRINTVFNVFFVIITEFWCRGADENDRVGARRATVTRLRSERGGGVRTKLIFKRFGTVKRRAGSG